MMKKNLFYRSILVYVASITMISGAIGIAEKIEEAGQKLRNSSDQIFIGVVEEKKQQLSALKKTLETFDEETRKGSTILKEDVERVSGRLAAIKGELQKNGDSEFNNKQLFIMNETYQVLHDLIRSRDQVHILLELFIKEIQSFLDDFDFEGYKIEHRLQERLYYSFEDLQKIHQRVTEQKKRVDQLVDQEKNAKVELDVLKRTMAITVESLKKKQNEVEGLATSIALQEGEFALEIEQNITLARDQEQLDRYKVLLYEVSLREVGYKVDLYAHQSFIAKSHLALFKEYVHKIKPSVRVSEADIAYAKDELGKRKQEYYKVKEKYRQDIDKLQDEFKKKDQQRQKVSAAFNISLGREIDDFTKDPAQTVDAYVSFCEVSRANVDVLLIKTKIELLNAQIALEDEKFNYEQLQIDVKESYYKIVTRKLTSDDEIIQETKKYGAPFAESKSKSLRYKEKITQIGELLSIKKGVIDSIVRQRKELAKLKNTVFKANAKEYAQCLNLLTQSEGIVKNQIDILSKLTGVYSGTSSIIGNNSRLIDFIKTELEAITIWYRPEYAISWQAARNIPSDISLFFSDMKSYLARFDKGTLATYVKSAFYRPGYTVGWYFLFLVMWGLILLALLLFIKHFLPLSIQFLTKASKGFEGIARSALLILILLLQFINHIFWGLACWLSCYAFLYFHMIPDPYVYVFFYLLSIPYLLLVAYRFNRYLILFNEKNNYSLLMRQYQGRFVLVFSILMYSTIIITFFREAFMLTNYNKSELPRVLLALNFIIQILLIFFVIPRNQLLSAFPTHNEWWRWMGREIARYYYALLFFIFFIIVVGSPYIGHFRLVEYVFFAVIKTVILLLGLVVCYMLFKRLGYRALFYTDKEVARERFANSKTWFGFLIIALLLVVAAAGIFVAIRIWGWQIDFNDVRSWLHEHRWRIGTSTPITIYSFLQIIWFVIAGFFISYALNRFVLDKIFDLLLVDMGVQHTVTRIMHYIVITIALFIGFQSVGLGDTIGWIITALAISLGWVLKEPISDFVAYFIILVQRPLKIGDFVKINAEMEGVVRRITPRSVILRSKNSTTVVIPNSMITTQCITNWNYTRSFIALNDIELVISFSHDPALVHDLLRQVVEAHSNILKTPAVIVRLEAFLEYGYKFMIRGFVSSVYTLEMWNIASDVRLAIVKKLREKNIALAVPVRFIQQINNGEKQ